MTSIVEICNRALQLLQQERISDLAEASPQAQACANAYPSVRDALLDEYPWNFAIRRARLAASTQAPTWGAGTLYPLPSDCLRVVTVDGDAGAGAGMEPAWRIEGRSILSVLGPPLDIRYVARVEDPTIMTASFRELLAVRLAIEIVGDISGSRADLEALARRYRDQLPLTRSRDAQETGRRTNNTSQWISTRW